MFKYINIAILAIVLVSLCKCKGSDLTKKVISNIVKAVPQLKEEINKSPQSRTTLVSHIVGSGFSTFRQQSDLELYTGVHDDHLENFLGYVQRAANIPEAYAKFFVENLSMILYSDFNEIVIYRVLFSIGKGADCKYICVMGERNEDNSTNWLVGEVRAQFSLAPDLLVLEESKSAAFGLYKSKSTKVVSIPKALDEEKLTVIFKFFEICVFEKFAELLHINVSDSSNFLS